MPPRKIMQKGTKISLSHLKRYHSFCTYIHICFNVTFFFLSFSTEHEYYSCNCSLRDEAKACIFKITVFQCEGRKCCSRGRVLLCLAKKFSPCYQSSSPPPPHLPPMRSGLVVPPFHTSIEIECWNFVRHV